MLVRAKVRLMRGWRAKRRRQKAAGMGGSSSRRQSYGRIFITHAAYVAVLFLFAGVYTLAGVMDDVIGNAWLLNGNNIVMGAVLIFVVALLYLRWDKGKLSELGWRLSVRDGRFLAAAMVVTVGMAAGFLAVLGHRTAMQVEVRWELFGEPACYGLLIWSGAGWLIAALKEEVLSRGYVMANLRHLGAAGMIAISAVLFMALHFPTNGFEITRAASWLMGGVLYGYVYWKSGSLWVSAITHGIHNFVNELLINRADDYALAWLSRQVISGEKLAYEVLLKVVLLAIACWMYRDHRTANPPR
jgi:membrane protease YdiL (CAAX protease family)